MDTKQILAIQQRRNRETQNNWVRSQSHRETVSSHLISQGNASLLRCYGAGNCNDLDLQKLSKVFTAIELIDIDSDSMESALVRQNITDKHGVRLLGGIDLSVGAHDAKQLADITVSSCLFTQLLEQQIDKQSANAQVLSDFRATHFDMLIRSTAPAGHIYFITDIVSDLTAPQLSQLPTTQLNGFLSHAVGKRNFFSGTNPFASEEQLLEDPRVASTRILDAWIWKLGPRIFAVYGIHAQLV